MVISAPKGALTRAETENNKWLDQLIKTLPASHRAHARNSWHMVYDKAFESEPDENYKLNRARREANTRLRHYVERVNKPPTNMLQ